MKATALVNWNAINRHAQKEKHDYQPHNNLVRRGESPLAIISEGEEESMLQIIS